MNDNMIYELVEKFSHNFDEYKNPKYNETQIRVEFVNPFFEMLGWDVNNKAGYAMAFRDVVHEDEVRIGRTTKAPDYSFRIGGTRIFFVETKKPSIDLKHDPAPAFQLRRYAYSAGLPVSILTDFEEFIVYDCRIKPAITDKPHVGRMLYMTFEDYAARWDELSTIFGKEAVMRGDLGRWIEDVKGKKPRAELDKDFLADLDKWRILLARNLALRNPQLTNQELNWAVQLTIDRLIFLRMCEDRGIESQYTLQVLLNGERAYRRLVEIYYRADERYNSGLFHFSVKDGDFPDTLTPDLILDDKVLKEIISELYYPKCAYEFGVLPVEILGHAYEQFLGKQIRLTEGHRAKIEEKPEVRKAGGVYYTPQYIVEYIVENTVGKLLDGKAPKQASDLRIVDPACGSGSFLLGAFEYLMKWHKDQYVAEFEDTGNIPTVLPGKGQRKRKSDPPAIFKGMGDQWLLTTAEKKRILTDNIYGVDIDANAVEVTKLSLLLKVLENENSETLHNQMGLWHERALPNLSGNIKCGNSLIGSDFYEHQQTALFNDEEMHRINAFDWEQQFPEIFKKGGFDAVIGNPPYVRQEMLKEIKSYLKVHYSTFHGGADLYVYFIEMAHRLLTLNGMFSFICSNKFLKAKYGSELRSFLATQTQIKQILNFGELPIFKDAATFPAILITKNLQTKSQTFTYVQVETLSFSSINDVVNTSGIKIQDEAISQFSWILASEQETRLIRKINLKGIPLKKYINQEIFRGILTGYNKAFIIDDMIRNDLIEGDIGCSSFIKPYVKGDNIRKFHLNYCGLYLIIIPKGFTNKRRDENLSAENWFSNEFPSLYSHLVKYKSELEKRWDKGDYWWELRECDYYDRLEDEKILFPDIAKESRLTIDDKGFFITNTGYFIPSNDRYLLGILNSKLIWFFYSFNAAVLGDAKMGGRLRWFRQDVEKIPIVSIDKENERKVKKHESIVHNVNNIMNLHKKLAEARDPRTQEQLKRRIDATDNQIDKLVYELYGLTDEEIAIVEGG